MRELPDGWKETTLGAVGKAITGKTPSKNNLEHWGNVLDFITPTDFKGDGKFLSQVDRKLSDEGETAFKRLVIPSKSVIVTCIGSDMGKVAINKNDCVTNQQINSLIIHQDKYDADFTHYLLKASYKVLRLYADGGSTMPIINKSTFESLTFKIPPLPEQKAIADMLSSFDDKIELLREQNKTLETLAQTIFKEWFVNFNYPDATGEMVDSELGEIPKGWRVGTLRDVVDIFDSKRIPLSSNERQKRQGIYPYYGATKAMDYIDDYLFDGTYLLMAEDGSVMDDNGYPFLQYVWGKFWVNNHTHTLQGKNGFSTAALYVFLKRRKVAGIVNGAVQLKINQTNLMGFDMLLPADDVMQKFNALLQPVFEKIKNNASQVQSLSKTRDTLLPKLMNGQVRVKAWPTNLPSPSK